jgi:hypothetical protein
MQDISSAIDKFNEHGLNARRTKMNEESLQKVSASASVNVLEGENTRVPNPDFSGVEVIEKRDLQSETIGLCLGAARKPSYWSKHPR